jgi:hypothetical protein
LLIYFHLFKFRAIKMSKISLIQSTRFRSPFTRKIMSLKKARKKNSYRLLIISRMTLISLSTSEHGNVLLHRWWTINFLWYYELLFPVALEWSWMLKRLSRNLIHIERDCIVLLWSRWTCDAMMRCSAGIQLRSWANEFFLQS